MVYQVSGDNLRELSQQTLEQFTQAFNHQFLNRDQSQPQIHLGIPKTIGMGGIRLSHIGDSLISELNFRFSRDLRLFEHSPGDMCFLNINIGSPVDFNVDGRGTMVIRPNTVYLGKAVSGDTFKTDIQQTTSIHSLSFCFSRAEIDQYLAELGRQDLSLALQQQDCSCMIHSAVLSPQQCQLITQLRQPIYGGVLGKLRFETHMQSLLLSCLESLCQNRCPDGLNDMEIALLEQAHKHLLANYRNPPTIPQLAKHIGVNQDKLKKGFRLRYNRTILQTLTRHRMKLALEALTREGLSVSETAETVGYDNVSHFITVFKRHHGVTPGEIRQPKRIYLG